MQIGDEHGNLLDILNEYVEPPPYVELQPRPPVMPRPQFVRRYIPSAPPVKPAPPIPRNQSRQFGHVVNNN
jgi:hypothetical protein